MSTPRLIGTHKHHTNDLWGPGSGGGGGTGGGVVNLTNTDAGSIALGDVVIEDITANNSVKRTTNYADGLVVGVVAGTGPYATGSTVVPVLVNGYTSSLKVTGSVNVGDWLVTDSTSGKAISAGPNIVNKAFARAISTASGGLCAAIVFEVVTVDVTEVPDRIIFDMSGMTNGVATTFNTPDFFVEDTCAVYRNGLLLRPIVDYNETATLDGITMVAAPTAADELIAIYRAQVV